MAHTNRTANYDLPQFAPTDKPSWLGDVNELAEKTDAQLARLEGLINNLQTQVNNKADKVTP